jgi:hypothetical protein
MTERRVMQTLGKPDTPEGVIIGARCIDCDHVSETVGVSHAREEFICEECGGCVTQELIDE